MYISVALRDDFSTAGSAGNIASGRWNRGCNQQLVTGKLGDKFERQLFVLSFVV